MVKKLDHTLNIMAGSFAGVFIGHGIYVFWDYKTHPGLYAMRSAPWYTSIFVWGIFTAVFLIITVILKFVIRKKLK